jgi:hypothetical protein
MIQMFGKLRARAIKAYLRFRIREALADADAIQADAITAPRRVAAIRVYVAKLSARLAALEAA